MFCVGVCVCVGVCCLFYFFICFVLCIKGVIVWKKNDKKEDNTFPLFCISTRNLCDCQRNSSSLNQIKGQLDGALL